MNTGPEFYPSDGLDEGSDPGDESQESVMAREVEEIKKNGENRVDEILEGVAIPFDLDESELVENHPAIEVVGEILENIRAEMWFFRVADASKITIEKVRQLGHDLYYDLPVLNDLVLIVKDELTEQDQDRLTPTPLRFDHIIEASNRIDIYQRLNEESVKAVNNLAEKLFGNDSRDLLFRKAIESSVNARKIRRFSWLLNQPYMEDFPNTVRRDRLLRDYSWRTNHEFVTEPLTFPGILDLAYRTLQGMKVQCEQEMKRIKSPDLQTEINSLVELMDLQRAIAVCEAASQVQ